MQYSSYGVNGVNSDGLEDDEERSKFCNFSICRYLFIPFLSTFALFIMLIPPVYDNLEKLFSSKYAAASIVLSFNFIITLILYTLSYRCFPIRNSNNRNEI